MFIMKWLVLKIRPFIERFPKIATMYRNFRDQMDYMDEPDLTPWGFKLAGNKLMSKGIFEPEETKLVSELLRDSDILVNVGANVGYYCCHALNMGKPIIAFEPIQRNFRYLLKNIKYNGWSDAEIFPLALSNSVGIIEIYGGDTGASLIKGWGGVCDNYMTLAPSSTMDIVLGTRLRGKKALIIVDIEGAERWMLEGASLMLANDPKPIWLMEIASMEHQPSGVEINPDFSKTFQLFFNNGYQAFYANQGMRPFTMEDVNLVTIGKLELNTNNFIFMNKNKD